MRHLLNEKSSARGTRGGRTPDSSIIVLGGEDQQTPSVVVSCDPRSGNRIVDGNLSLGVGTREDDEGFQVDRVRRLPCRPVDDEVLHHSLPLVPHHWLPLVVCNRLDAGGVRR